MGSFMGDIGESGVAGVMLPAEVRLTMPREALELTLVLDWDVAMKGSPFWALSRREKRPMSGRLFKRRRRGRRRVGRKGENRETMRPLGSLSQNHLKIIVEL